LNPASVNTMPKLAAIAWYGEGFIDLDSERRGGIQRALGGRFQRVRAWAWYRPGRYFLSIELKSD